MCRHADYAERLVDTFEAPDNHIFTLHDTLEASIAKYGDVSFLELSVHLFTLRSILSLYTFLYRERTLVGAK